MLKKKQYENIVLISIFLGFALMSFLIIKPYAIAILFGLILAYLFYPMYKWMLTKIKNQTASAFIVSLIIIIVISVPLLFLANVFVGEIVNVIQGIRASSQAGYSSDYFSEVAICNHLGSVCQRWPWVENVISDINFQEVIVSFGSKVTQILTSIPDRILSIFIILFTTFYGFIDGKRLIKTMWRAIPIKTIERIKLRKSFEDMIYAVIYASIVVAIIQGAVGGLGFWIFGIKSWVIWMFVMMIASLVPYIGTAIVWVPASLYLMWYNFSIENMTGVFMGMGLFVYGVAIISTIDNIVKPKLLGNRARVHPVVVLIGILGGLQFFGASGIIFGPLVLALFQSILSISRGKTEGEETK